MARKQEHDGARQRDDDDGSVRGWRQLARILLVLYVAALAGLAYWCSMNPGQWESLTWRPANAIFIAQVAGHIGSSVGKDFLLFLVLGFLTGAACAPGDRESSLIAVLFSTLVAFALSLGIALVLRTLMNGTPIVTPMFVTVMILALACFWGSWLGTTWMGASNSVGWFFRQAFAAVFVGCTGALALTWFALSPAPLAISPAAVSSDDRRRLVKLFQEHDPRDLDEQETTDMTITERDVNQLASWGLSLLPGDHLVEFALRNDEIAMRVSFQLPPIPVLNRHVNLTVAGRPLAREGELGVSPSVLELGRLQIPRWLLRRSGPIVIGDEWRYEATEPFMRSLQSIKVNDGIAKISYGHLDIKKGFVGDTLVGLGMMEDLEPATSAHVANLIALAEQNPKLEFAECLEAAFGEAKKRSIDGGAVQENRAAILAVGYLLGHSKIRTFVGAGLPAPSNEARQTLRRVTLRNRRDWTQHYSVSAALQVLSNALASMDVGLLKEELDADGGSGFSFGDLLADRAGTMLAVRATESESAAKAMQDRLAAGFALSDFMPEGADLPEGLSDQEFKNQFGGVGGEGYKRLLAEIDRRIEDCPAYKSQ
jgi:hypothetical protein